MEGSLADKETKSGSSNMAQEKLLQLFIVGLQAK